MPTDPPADPSLRHGWVLLGAIATAGRRARDAWERLDAGARRRWLVRAALGVAGLFALSGALVVVGQTLMAAGALDWEAAFIRAVEERVSLRIGLWAEIPGNSLVAVPLVLFAAGWAAWRARPLRALLLALLVPLYKLSIGLGWMLWSRARPQVVDGALSEVYQGWSSFPSGHVVQALLVYGLLVYLWVRRSASVAERLLGAALVVAVTAGSAVGRLRVGAHWPSDLLGGVVLGAAWLVFVVAMIRMADRAEALGPRRV